MNLHRFKHTRTRYPGLMLIVVGTILVVMSATLLASCGSATPAAGAAVPTTVAQAPTPTPTPTLVPATQTPAPGSTHMLMITNDSNGSFGFNPSMLTIRAGTTVIWKNVSSVPHTVTSDDGQTFDSGNIAVGGTFKFTFENAGTYSYHCNIHPYMRATIVVV